MPRCASCLALFSEDCEGVVAEELLSQAIQACTGVSGWRVAGENRCLVLHHERALACLLHHPTPPDRSEVGDGTGVGTDGPRAPEQRRIGGDAQLGSRSPSDLRLLLRPCVSNEIVSWNRQTGADDGYPGGGCVATRGVKFCSINSLKPVVKFICILSIVETPF